MRRAEPVVPHGGGKKPDVRRLDDAPRVLQPKVGTRGSPRRLVVRQVLVFRSVGKLDPDREHQIGERIVARPEVRHDDRRSAGQVERNGCTRFAEELGFRPNAVTHEQSRQDVRRRAETEIPHRHDDGDVLAGLEVVRGEGKIVLGHGEVDSGRTFEHADFRVAELDFPRRVRRDREALEDDRQHPVGRERSGKRGNAASGFPRHLDRSAPRAKVGVEGHRDRMRRTEIVAVGFVPDERQLAARTVDGAGGTGNPRIVRRHDRVEGRRRPIGDPLAQRSILRPQSEDGAVRADPSNRRFRVVELCGQRNWRAQRAVAPRQGGNATILRCGTIGIRVGRPDDRRRGSVAGEVETENRSGVLRNRGRLRPDAAREPCRPQLRRRTGRSGESFRRVPDPDDRRRSVRRDRDPRRQIRHRVVGQVRGRPFARGGIPDRHGDFHGATQIRETVGVR